MNINSSAPGRICLFGEHQDYLGFPVIAAAIDLRLSVKGTVSEKKHPETQPIRLNLLNKNETIEFDPQNIQYSHKQDYLKSVVNVLKKEGIFRPQTIDARIQGNVPIKAGTSSSAALSVAWAGFLLKASGVYESGGFFDNPSRVAELAYNAEVTEFNESGGRMDQYTSAIGGIVHLDFKETVTPTSLPIAVNEFVLGDSLQQKDTQKTLSRVRTAQEEGFRILSEFLPFRYTNSITFGEAEHYFNKIPSNILPYLKAALANHQITQEARAELLKPVFDMYRFSLLMNRHQEFLRDYLKVSTLKIDTMIESAMNAGALAGKINGSGEGGCMLAYCPGKQEQVAEAIARTGGVPYIINIGPGLSVSEI